MKTIASSIQGTWFGVNLFAERPVDQFTDAILDNPEAGNIVEGFFHWLKVQVGLTWTPADPDDPDTPRCCVGTVHHMTVSGDGDIGIYITPDPTCEELAGGQALLVCEMPWGMRNDFRRALKKLHVGKHVKICGYWVIDGGHNGGQRELHPITGILPLAP